MFFAKISTYKYYWINLFVFLFLGCVTLPLISLKEVPLLEYPKPQKKHGIALVLGAGGAKGLAHIAVIRQLEKAGIPIDFIVGSSAGSIVGALYADLPDAKKWKSVLLNTKRIDMMGLTTTNPYSGLSSGSNLRKYLSKHLRSRLFEDLSVPLVVVATDLTSGEAVEFGSGSLIPAIHSASAFPFLFKPVEHMNRHLVDGGVSNPIPADVAKNIGTSLVVAVDISGGLSGDFSYNLLGITKRSLQIMYKNHSEKSAKIADIVIKPDLLDVDTFGDSNNRFIYKAGKLAAKSSIPEIKKRLFIN